jgi:hypothetical protein
MIPQFGTSVTDNFRGVIYDDNVFIIQANGDTVSINKLDRFEKKTVSCLFDET